MKKSILIALPLLALCLTSCGGGPSKGYNMFKDQTENWCIANGLTKDVIRWEHCSYVELVDSGTISIGTLSGNVYYKINYSLNVTSYNSFVTYVTYYPSNDIVVEESSSTAYVYAYELVNSGALKGNIGSL